MDSTLLGWWLVSLGPDGVGWGGSVATNRASEAEPG